MTITAVVVGPAVPRPHIATPGRASAAASGGAVADAPATAVAAAPPPGLPAHPAAAMLAALIARMGGAAQPTARGSYIDIRI